MGVRELAQDFISDESPAKAPGPQSEEHIPTEQGGMETDTMLGESAGQSLVDQGIGVMVAVIVIGAVAIPVVQDVIASANLTGTSGTIMDFVPLALALALFVGAISMVR